MADFLDESIKQKYRQYFVNDPLKFMKDAIDWNALVEKLEHEPQFGKPLRGKLHGIWQLRIGTFRVWYEISYKVMKVILRAILHKDEAKKFY